MLCGRGLRLSHACRAHSCFVRGTARAALAGCAGPKARTHDHTPLRTRAHAAELRPCVNAKGPFAHTDAASNPIDTRLKAMSGDAEVATLECEPLSGGRKLRILCLHGYLQSADLFSRRIGSVRKGLKSQAEWFFVDAPFTVHTDDNEIAAAAQGRTDGRSWWNWVDDGTGGRPSTSADYVGIDEAMAVLEAACREHAPVDGVFGFSQGATAAALFAAHLPNSALPEGLRPKFFTLVAGFPPRDPKYASLLSDACPGMPSLHVYGEGDELVPAERSEALKSCFANAEEYRHPGAHMVPTCTGDFKARMRVYLTDARSALEDAED